MLQDEFAPEQRKNRRLVGWKAWYTDGSVYTSDLYNWIDIPQRKFAFVKRFWQAKDEVGYDTEEPVYGEILACDDIYILDDDYRDNCYLPQYIKVGEWMRDADFHPLFDAAKADSEVIENMI